MPPPNKENVKSEKRRLSAKNEVSSNIVNSVLAPRIPASSTSNVDELVNSTLLSENVLDISALGKAISESPERLKDTVNSSTVKFSSTI